MAKSKPASSNRQCRPRRFWRAREQDGLPRLRYWRGAWYMWRRGRYAEIQQSEVQADLILDINREFAFLTTSIVANVVQQVKAQSAIWSHVETAGLDG